MTTASVNARAIEQYCPSCDVDRGHSLRPTVLQETTPGFDIATCVACGIESAYPMPTADALSAWYANRISPGEPLENPLRKIWVKIHDRFILNKIASYAPTGAVLDIGAGRGRTSTKLQATKRYQCYATDYSDESISRLKAIGVTAFQGSIENVPLPNSSIDLVFASHLFEHLPDLGLFLDRVRQLLKPDGVVILLVPSRGSMRAKLGLTTWHVVNPLMHLWSFDRNSITNVLTNAGYEVLETFEFHIICELMVVARPKR